MIRATHLDKVAMILPAGKLTLVNSATACRYFCAALWYHSRPVVVETEGSSGSRYFVAGSVQCRGLRDNSFSFTVVQRVQFLPYLLFVDHLLCTDSQGWGT